MARFLTGRDIVKIVSSPLERAQQTAAPLAKAYGLEVEIDPRIIESSNYFEGGVVEPGPGILRHPQHWHALRNPFRPSWGEPYKEVAARVMAAVEDAREAARGHEVVLVSHQLPVFVTRRTAEQRPLWHRPDRRQCALASVTSLVFEEAAPQRRKAGIRPVLRAKRTRDQQAGLGRRLTRLLMLALPPRNTGERG